MRERPFILKRSRRGNQQETLRQKDRIWTKLWKAAGQRRRGEIFQAYRTERADSFLCFFFDYMERGQHPVSESG